MFDEHFLQKCLLCQKINIGMGLYGFPGNIMQAGNLSNKKRIFFPEKDKKKGKKNQGQYILALEKNPPCHTSPHTPPTHTKMMWFYQHFHNW